MKNPRLFSLLLALIIGHSSLVISAATAADAYLFAHMTKADYGRLYYSVSTDGLNWTLLNNGERVMDETYRGHPDIMQGRNGTYWLVGVRERDHPGVIFFSSSDLITWEPGPQLDASHFNVGERTGGIPSLGAPKLFWDDASELFYLTWHAARRNLPENMIDGVKEHLWSDMRTFVMTSPDLVEWSTARRLFQYDMATIDVIIREEGGTYYAILKDELYPTFDHATGKAIRIASAESPLGPWTEPGPAISSNYHEAPTLIPTAEDDGWLLYHEQYPGIQYGISSARTLDGPWYERWINTYSVPAEARHGCMLAIPGELYDGLLAAFPPGEPAD